jgi:hypothetical protein
MRAPAPENVVTQAGRILSSRVRGMGQASVRIGYVNRKILNKEKSRRAAPDPDPTCVLR